MDWGRLLMKACWEKSKRSLLRNVVVAAAMVFVCGFAAAPNASADQFDLNILNCSCLPAGTTAGTVTVAQNGSNSITVTVALTAGLQFHQAPGGGALDAFSFNGPALTAANLVLPAGLTFFSPGINADGAGSFQYALRCVPAANGCAGFPTSLTFTINLAGITPGSIETTNGGASNADFAANVAI